MDAVSTILDLPLDLTDEYLQAHANVDALTDQYQKTYQYIRRSVKPSGFLIYEKLALKLYYMIRETELPPQNLQENLYIFIDGEIEQERLDTKQGIGFAILSQGFLSINTWGRGNVLFTQTYTVEGSFPELSSKPLEETGVACTWEIRIMNYEYNLWHRYLETEMTVVDKKKYLQTFIIGNLW